MSEGPSYVKPSDTPPKWQPIGAIDRRVAGVLVEKAKTTPNAYPMSLNAVCTAANQKSNRAPVMQLEPDDVEESLDRLRQLGAVGVIEGYGRVSKYRHYLYEWLGVDKVEVAVMGELLLRGAQTEGELRGRAARMEPITDLSALRPVVASLKSKGLVVSLTPEGRGHVVTHVLYQPRELENLKAQYGSTGSVAPQQDAPATRPAPAVRDPAAEPAAAPPSAAAAAPLQAASMEAELVAAIHRDISELRAQLGQLRSDVDDLSTQHDRTDDELRQLKDSLGA